MKITVLFIVIAFAVTNLMSLGKSTQEIKNINAIDDSTTVRTEDSTAISKQILVKYILQQDISHPEVAYAIARHESDLSSKLFKSNNNLFGMRHPGVRPTLSVKKKFGYADFICWQHSVQDYKLYLEFVKGHKMDKTSYLRHLDVNYAYRGYAKVLNAYFNEFHSIKDSLDL